MSMESFKFIQSESDNEQLVIFGNGRIAKTLFQYLHNSFSVSAFTVDSEYILENEIYGRPVIPFEEIQQARAPSKYKMLIAIGYHDMNTVREHKYKLAKMLGYEFINYIHPTVSYHDDLNIGENNIILDNVSLMPDCEIGNNNFIWSNSVLAHGVLLEDHCWLSAGSIVSADVCIKSNCFLGINSSIAQNIVLAHQTFVGANVFQTRSSNAKEVFISRGVEKSRLDSARFLKFTGL